MKKPTEKQIASEIKKLQAILANPTFRKKSRFGDDNEESVKAQILVLQGKMSENDINDIDDDYINNSAYGALQWMNGEEIDEGSPSESWSGVYNE